MTLNTIFVITFLVALLVSMLIVATQRWHWKMSTDSTFGVQKVHTGDTPRVGGIAVAVGLVMAWLLVKPDVQAILGPMLLAAIPAFAFGLAEDLTKKVGIRPRLLATMFSGGLAWYLTGVAMQNTGVTPLDFLLAFTPAAVLFTAFAVGGVANAVNIIDGFNGLAAGSVAIMLAAMGLIALNVGDVPLASVCFVVASCALGFGIINWPLGKIFLGDGGAYLLGFLLAWVAVLLPMRNPQLSAWTTLLVCAYPVLEVGFSVRRRQKRVGQQAGQPDKAHLHHFIHRRLVCPAFVGLNGTMKNSLTSPSCWIATALPAACAVAFSENITLLALCFGLTIFAYAAIYARLTQFRWCFSAVTTRPVLAALNKSSIK